MVIYLFKDLKSEMNFIMIENDEPTIEPEVLKPGARGFSGFPWMGPIDGVKVGNTTIPADVDADTGEVIDHGYRTIQTTDSE